MATRSGMRGRGEDLECTFSRHRIPETWCNFNDHSAGHIYYIRAIRWLIIITRLAVSLSLHALSVATSSTAPCALPFLDSRSQVDLPGKVCFGLRMEPPVVIGNLCISALAFDFSIYLLSEMLGLPHQHSTSPQDPVPSTTPSFSEYR